MEVEGGIVEVGSSVSKKVGDVCVVGRRLGRGRREGLVVREFSIEGAGVSVGRDVGRVSVIGDDVAVKLGGSTIGVAVGRGSRMLDGWIVGADGCGLAVIPTLLGVLVATVGRSVVLFVTVGDCVIFIGAMDGASVSSRALQVSTSTKLVQLNSQSVRFTSKQPLPGSS